MSTENELPDYNPDEEQREPQSDESGETAHESAPHFTPEYVTPHVSMEDAVITQLTEDASRFIYAVGTTIGQVMQYIETAQDRKPAATGIERATFEAVLSGATADTHYAHDDLQPACDAPTADWKQYVEHNGKKIRVAKPPLAASANSPEVITGGQALLLMEQLRGLGQTVSVPLPHTGIWVTLRSAKLSAITQLDTRLANEKAKLGRLSRGYAFSNDGVITNEILFDFIMSHVVDCTLQNWTPESLANIIRVQDLGILAHAQACSMYPKGFPFAQACTVQVDACMHVTKAKLNLTKMFWTDNNKLTPLQKARIAARSERVPQSVLQTYQENWLEVKSGVINRDNTRFILQIPTMRQHIDSGIAWVNDLETMTEEALTKLSSESREDYMLTQGMATRLCSIAHWVKEIEFDVPGADGEMETKRVNDPATIRALLRDLSSEADERNAILDGVMAYINDTTCSLIAIPNYPCGNCKKWQRTLEAPNSALIPFDPINTFFTLQQFKLMEAQEKELI